MGIDVIGNNPVLLYTSQNQFYIAKTLTSNRYSHSLKLKQAAYFLHIVGRMD